MDTKISEALIRQGESQTVEFKENLDNEALETAAAFANTKGGSILIGVSDKKEIKGIQIGKDTLKDWANRISQSTDPRVIPEIETGEIDGKTVVIIRIKEFPIKPVSLKGKYFRRVSNSNRVMTHQEIAQVHFDSAGMSWDKLPARNSTLDDIDLEKVKKYIQKANESGRRKIGNDADPIQVLEKLELLKDGKPAWAAMLLFRKASKSLISQAAVHCGRFKEATVVIDDRMIEGTLAEQIEEVMDFIRKNIQVEFVMTGKPAREEKWTYPLEALREAVINSVCHRDYTALSNIEVRIYDDKLLIWNPGGLPFGFKLDDLYKTHPSVLRNKGIGGIFYDVGLIEQWGRGIEQMRNACKRAGLPEPIFEEYQQGFQVSFRKEIFTEEFLKEKGLNDRQIKAVFYAKEKGRINNQELQELFKVSKRTATNDLEDLVKKELFERVGMHGRGTFYRLRKGQ